MLKEYLKAEWKGMLSAIGVTVVVGALCWGYIVYVGAPITKARNLFNEGMMYFESGDYEKAKTLFEESEKLWWTEETDNYLQQATANS